MKHSKIRSRLTDGDYNNLLIKQRYVCAICYLPETSKSTKGKIRQLAVDHCHKTNIIRGLLCARCNKGIGVFNDDALLMYRAAKYLS